MNLSLVRPDSTAPVAAAGAGVIAMSGIKKIYDTPDLDNFLGDRLRLGR
jgi:hypothetical protein